jgi:hypothetical protein
MSVKWPPKTAVVGAAFGLLCTAAWPANTAISRGPVVL